MKEERMAILKMVEDGKINADDAVKLLSVLAKVKKFDGAQFQSGFEDKVKQFAKNMDEMSKELGKKLEEVGKDVEPALKKVATTIIEKTSECVEDISKVFKKEDECCCNETEPEECRCTEDENNDGCCCADQPKDN